MSLFRQFLNWFTGKSQLTKEQLKEVVSDLAPPPPSAPSIRTIQDLRAAQEIRTLQELTVFSEEVRKTLTIMKLTSQKRFDNDAILKHSIDTLYVEIGNINDKVRALASRAQSKSQKQGAAPLKKLSKEA